MSLHMSVGVHGGPKKVLDPLDLDFRAACEPPDVAQQCVTHVSSAWNNFIKASTKWIQRERTQHGLKRGSQTRQQHTCHSPYVEGMVLYLLPELSWEWDGIWVSKSHASPSTLIVLETLVDPNENRKARVLRNAVCRGFSTPKQDVWGVVWSRWYFSKITK